MGKKLIFITLLLVSLFSTSYAKVIYFSAGFSTQISLESLSFFGKKTGTILDKLMSSELFPILKNIRVNLFNQIKEFENSAHKLHNSFQKSLSLFVQLYKKRKNGTAQVGSMDDSDLDGLGPLLNSTHDLRSFVGELRKLHRNGTFKKLGESGSHLKELIVDLENTAKQALSLKDSLFAQLNEFGVYNQDDLMKIWNEISTPGTNLNDALRQKFSPLFSSGFQGYFQVGLPIFQSDFYYGFELGFGMNLGRLIVPHLRLLESSYPVKLGMGIMPRLFVKYDIYYLAATLFSGFGDKSLVVDPIYVGNLASKNKITNPFSVIETGLRLRLAFLNFESSVLFSINDFKYRDLRVGLGFEIPIII
ncbi:hypothetical protein [Borrelia crocidurae]|uniref:hypothetical protein n=1 Tax=Borrelia crocidurae TaxID=29520 RepID=UPI0005916AC2|nr:hypothetical protein [Borrelia crocidurae]